MRDSLACLLLASFALWACEGGSRDRSPRLTETSPGRLAAANTLEFSAEGCCATTIASGDFNGDGHADLVVPRAEANGDGNSFNDDGIVVFFGRGDGDFESAAIFPGHESAFDGMTVVTANLDGDHLDDVAVLNRHGLMVYRARATGGFADPVYFENGHGFDDCRRKMVAADFTGDGLDDLAYEDQVAEVMTHLGRAGADPEPGPASSIDGIDHCALAALDFDDDGALDLLVSTSHELWTARGDGHGGFTAERHFHGSDDRPSLGQLAVADFGQDGLQDFAVAVSQSNRLDLWQARRGGVFDLVRQVELPAVAVDIVAADFDGDGQADLATANQEAGTVSVILMSGSFSPRSRTDIETDGQALALSVGDFDSDAIDDLAILNAEPRPSIRLLLSATH